MKLVDKMKDENLGLAILYNFTKGYGHVPMKVYDVVLPLLYHDEFRNQLSTGVSVDEALDNCVKADNNFIKDILDTIEKDKEMTNKTLGICLLNKYLNFVFEETEMKGILLESTILDINEAIELGKYFSGKSYDEIEQILKKKSNHIVFLDYETLGDDIDLSKLNVFGKVDAYPSSNKEEVLERIKDAEIIITNKCLLTKEVLQEAKNVKLICITATGINNVDLAYCHENDIVVCNVAGYSSLSVSQHTLALALDLMHKNSYYHNYIQSGKYSESGKFTHIGLKFNELAGKTWGIIGMGNIGKCVAKIVEAFGCKVQYYSTSGNNNNGGYQQVDFETLLKTSDVVSIHCPLNDKTKGLIDDDAFELMKNNALLINVGRGGIVDEEALVKALEEGKIAGAGLDVFESEPFSKDSPLLKINDESKLIMTPHIAWATVEARKRLFDLVIDNIKGYLSGDLKNVC